MPTIPDHMIPDVLSALRQAAETAIQRRASADNAHDWDTFQVQLSRYVHAHNTLAASAGVREVLRYPGV